MEKNKQLTFLDMVVKECGSKIRTSVHVKDTNYGVCINYKGICPDKYKLSVINTLLHRGYHISTDWYSFHQEILRIKQLLTNNNFPMNVIDKCVNNFLNNKLTPTTRENKSKYIQLYFKGQMSCHYKTEEKHLQRTIQKHVISVDPDKSVKLSIYYRNTKLSNLLIRNKTTNSTTSDKHHVVYLYKCNYEECNFSKYVGYTTCTLAERFRTHRSVRRHLEEHHNRRRVPVQELLECVEVLRSNTDKRRLKMMEALLIKEMKPGINNQEEGSYQLLKIFKH